MYFCTRIISGSISRCNPDAGLAALEEPLASPSFSALVRGGGPYNLAMDAPAADMRLVFARLSTWMKKLQTCSSPKISGSFWLGQKAQEGKRVKPTSRQGQSCTAACRAGAGRPVGTGPCGRNRNPRAPALFCHKLNEEGVPEWSDNMEGQLSLLPQAYSPSEWGRRLSRSHPGPPPVCDPAFPRTPMTTMPGWCILSNRAVAVMGR